MSKKQMFGFKADRRWMEFVEQLATLTKYGMTKTTYPTQSDLIRSAVEQEVDRLYEELLAVPMLAPLAEALRETYMEESEKDAKNNPADGQSD